MSKLRFFEVALIDGYGTSKEIVPAHSKENAEAYFANGHVRTEARFIGFQSVTTHYDGTEITFSGYDHTFDSRMPCYGYIYDQLQSQVNQMIAHLESKGMYP